MCFCDAWLPMLENTVEKIERLGLLRRSSRTERETHRDNPVRRGWVFERTNVKSAAALPIPSCTSQTHASSPSAECLGMRQGPWGRAAPPSWLACTLTSTRLRTLTATAGCCQGYRNSKIFKVTQITQPWLPVFTHRADAIPAKKTVLPGWHRRCGRALHTLCRTYCNTILIKTT